MSLFNLKEDKWNPAEVIRHRKVETPIVSRDFIKSKSEIVAEKHRAVFGDLMPADRILKEVCADTGVLAEDIKSVYRGYLVREARAILYYRLRTETNMSYQAIARFVGRTDHSTVLKVTRYYAKRFGLPMPGEPVFPKKETHDMSDLWWVQVKGCDPEPARVTERNGHKYAKIIGWEQEIPEGVNLKLISIIENRPVQWNTFEVKITEG